MKHSAGILLYKQDNQEVSVMLVHPGGPLWSRKDKGAWSIPKGEFAAEEEPLAAARREFAEELGRPVSDGIKLSPLGTVKISSGKTLHAWAGKADFDTSATKSNTFEMEWPPKSGQMQRFPEIDRAAWFSSEAARVKITKGQAPLLERLMQLLDRKAPETAPADAQVTPIVPEQMTLL